jgi:hypothetical protein
MTNEEERERRMEFALMEASTAWCKEKTSSKVMDVELAKEFAKILVIHMYEPHLGCASTGELIDELKARSDLEYSTIKKLK